VSIVVIVIGVALGVVAAAAALRVFAPLWREPPGPGAWTTSFVIGIAAVLVGAAAVWLSTRDSTEGSAELLLFAVGCVVGAAGLVLTGIAFYLYGISDDPIEVG
jgi:energy-converting hydrogenase Eha subunit A